MSRPTLKERQRQLREEAILEAAHELLAHKGYAAMSVDELAATVGISKATLYQHFASKDALAVRVVLRMLRQAEERMRAVDPRLPAIERLERMMREGLERRAMMWGSEAGMMPTLLRDHPEYRAQRATMDDQLRALIDAAKADGAVDPALHTPAVARTLAQLFQTDYADLAAGDEAGRREVASSLIQLLFDGLRKKP